MQHSARDREPTSTSTSLLERIRFHDRVAWQRFVPLYAPAIYEICRRSGVQPCDADDVTQEVLQAVSHAIGDFRKEQSGDTFRGWLYRIAQNKLRDHFRRSKREPPGRGGSDFQIRLDALPATGDANEEALTEVVENVALSRALELIRSDFQPHIWQAFWRITVGAERAVDVATDLNLTPNAVRQAKFRVMQRLRSEFGGLLDV